MGESLPVQDADNQMSHLYPLFMKRVSLIIEEATRECAKFSTEFSHMGMFEGYRSVARQEWLFEHGKTPVRIPDHHGFGLAADIVWYDNNRNPRWDGPDALWEQLGHCVRLFGLVWGGNWHNRDLVHCQPQPDTFNLWKPEAIKYLHEQGLKTPDG